ncbi:uncharacterized protein JCM15063_000336 [Sporobolomyces koalae]|uniref:uncharacterized protein n=1 Tax=Sporobolomyces koalae TaxID=500713 RepID=UPI00317E4240
MYLLPLLSLAAVVTAIPEESLFTWSRVNTVKPVASSSTSPLVWSKVNTATSSISPTSTSTVPVWSKVDTLSKSTSTSSSSPLVWSKVETTPRSSTTLSWTKVITTRTTSTSTPTSTTVPSSTPSSVVCPTQDVFWPPRSTTRPTCYQGQPISWTSQPAYINYQVSGAGFWNNTLATNGTNYYSGTPCPNIEIRSSVPVLEISAAINGGMDQLCGKKLLLNRNQDYTAPVRAIITHSCSSKYCPGASIGSGKNWYVPRGYKERPPGVWPFEPRYKFNVPDKLWTRFDIEMAYAEWMPQVVTYNFV